MKIGKIWGTTESLIANGLIEVHRLAIVPNARCSLHAHKFKHNAFFVQSGRLFIEVHKNDYALVDVTELGPGDMTSVKPGEYHRFYTEGEECRAIELYYPEQLSEDIVRKDAGSRQ